MSTVFALRAFYPDKRIAVSVIGAGQDDARFYRKHAGAKRIDRHTLHVEDFADFPEYPGDGVSAQEFAQWALLPDGWSLR